MMKLHFALPLLLVLESCFAISTRNLQEKTNDTVFDLDDNFTEAVAIPMLFDAFWGNDTAFATVSEPNGTFVIPKAWLRGGFVPDNTTEFVKFAPLNDTFFALPSDFNVTEFPEDFIRFKNSTAIQPNFRGGGDGNVTLLEDFLPIFVTTSFDPNVTLLEDVPPVLGMGFLDVPVAMEDVPLETTIIMEDVLDAPVEDVPLVTTTSLVTTTGGAPAGMPAWFSFIKERFQGGDLKLCSKRKNIAPANGSKCSKRMDKTCFFGNQACGDTTYPETRCKCSGAKSNRTWVCAATACP